MTDYPEAASACSELGGAEDWPNRGMQMLTALFVAIASAAFMLL